MLLVKSIYILGLLYISIFALGKISFMACLTQSITYLYEITNIKKLQDTAIGNFPATRTVSVKTHAPNLEKHLSLRRQVRVPMFSNVLNPYAIDERLSIPTEGDTIYSYKINKDDGDK